MFYERPDGVIVRGCGGRNDVAYVREDAGEIVDVPRAEFNTYKPRGDLRDFPNATDPRLPYDFDLLYDIKYMSQLRREVAYAEDKLATLRRLMDHYNITLETDDAEEE